MQLELTLMFDGTCREAFAFYAEVLGGRTGFMMTYGESPQASQYPPEHHAKVMHASMRLGNYILVGGDVLDDYRPPQGFSILLHVLDAGRARVLHANLGRAGEVVMPAQETFWSPCYGVVRDRFGVTWEINARSAEMPVIGIATGTGGSTEPAGSERAIHIDPATLQERRCRAQAQHHCSFCGKGGGEVRALVAGPGVFICDECIALCGDAMQTQAYGGAKPIASPQA